jgi:Tol biopolymer transport system component
VLVAAAVVVLAIGVMAARTYLGTSAVTAASPVQLELSPPANTSLTPAAVASTPQIAISPDGHWIAFVAAERHKPSQIWLRPLDNRETKPLEGTVGAQFPFWSPDSRYLAFFAEGKLKKIAIAGGGAQVLADAPAGRGGTWSSENLILFSPRPNSLVNRIAATGGAATTVGSSFANSDIIGDNWPVFLPDNRHFLVYQRSSNTAEQGVYVESLDDGRKARVLSNASLAQYASGHLLFVRDGSLFAIPFDERKLQTYGDERAIGDHVGYFSGSFGYASFSVTPNGLLAYGPFVAITTKLDWIDRTGRPLGTLGKPDAYTSPRLSPDEKTAAVAIIGPSMADRDVWTIDLQRGNPSRTTFDPSADWFPVWSADGGTIFFGSTRVQVTSVFEKVGVGDDSLIAGPKITRGYATYPTDASHDGRFLACTVSTEHAYDIGILTLGDTPKVTPFLSTAFNEAQARFSPNDRWLAYASDESGSFEVYVRSFPASDKQYKISAGGGTQPEWRHDGKELFYISTDGKMMAVPVVTDGDFTALTPHPLFDVDIPELVAPYANQYAVSHDGQRFLVNTVTDQSTRPALSVILNWTELLKR